MLCSVKKLRNNATVYCSSTTRFKVILRSRRTFVALQDKRICFFTVADHLQTIWGHTGPSSTFTTPSPPDHVTGSSNLHSLFSSSPLLAAANSAAAAAAAHLSLPPPPPPPQAASSGSRLTSPGSAEADMYGGQSGSYSSFGSFHQVH